MNRKQALNIALKAIYKQMQSLAFDANLFQKGLATGSHFENTHKEYTKLADAALWIENSLKQKSLFE